MRASSAGWAKPTGPRAGRRGSHTTGSMRRESLERGGRGANLLLRYVRDGANLLLRYVRRRVFEKEPPSGRSAVPRAVPILDCNYAVL